MEKDDLAPDPRGGVQVVARTAAIMRALSAHPGGLSLTAIANEVDLPRSTVQRLVTALEMEGLVDAKGPNGGTRLGPTISSLVATAHADMVVFGRHQLKLLLDAVNETCSIVTTVNARSMVLETMTAEHLLRTVLSQGVQTPLHVTAGGKALLAAHDDDMLERLFPQKLEIYTEHTIATRKALHAELLKVREHGIAYSRNEREMGVSSIAMAVASNMGLYAFEVTLPDARFDKQADHIEETLRVQRKQIMEQSTAFEKDKLTGSLGMLTAPNAP